MENGLISSIRQINSMRSTYLLVIMFFVSCGSSKLERDLKKAIAHSTEIYISLNDVRLEKHDGYYLAFRSDEKPTFYYLLDEVDDKYEMCHIETEKSWAESDYINNNIRSA